MNPITPFWDTRIVAVYALLGGYASHEAAQLHTELLKLADSGNDYMYIAGILARLELDNKITVSEAKNQIAKDSIYKHFKADHPNPKWFMSPPRNPLEYELLTVETEWFKKVLQEYLQLFKENQLYSQIGHQPSSYAKQRKRFFADLENSNGKRTLRVASGGWGNEYKILETALTLVDEDILDILSFELDTTLLSKIFVAEATVSLRDEDYVDNYRHVPLQPKSERTWLAELKVDGQTIAVRLHGEDWVVIKRLRADSGLYNFMHYIYAHPNANVGRADIQLLDGCDTYMDMTELPRRCGFDSKLKKIFFDGTTRLNVKLNNPKTLNSAEKDELVALLSNR